MQISQVAEGTALPAVSIPITLQRLVMEAGANRDFSLIHHDSGVARATGAPDAFANTFFLMGMFERLMREWAELFAAYHENVAPVKAIVMAKSTPYLVLKDGSTLGLFPSDYVALDETFIERNSVVIAALREQGLEPGEAWITGVVDPALIPVLQKIGWKDVSGEARKRVGLGVDS